MISEEDYANIIKNEQKEIDRIYAKPLVDDETIRAIRRDADIILKNTMTQMEANRLNFLTDEQIESEFNSYVQEETKNGLLTNFDDILGLNSYSTDGYRISVMKQLLFINHQKKAGLLERYHD